MPRGRASELLLAQHEWVSFSFVGYDLVTQLMQVDPSLGFPTVDEAFGALAQFGADNLDLAERCVLLSYLTWSPGDDPDPVCEVPNPSEVLGYFTATRGGYSFYVYWTMLNPDLHSRVLANLRESAPPDLEPLRELLRKTWLQPQLSEERKATLALAVFPEAPGMSPAAASDPSSLIYRFGPTT